MKRTLVIFSLAVVPVFINVDQAYDPVAREAAQKEREIATRAERQAREGRNGAAVGNTPFDEVRHDQNRATEAHAAAAAAQHAEHPAPQPQPSPQAAHRGGGGRN